MKNKETSKKKILDRLHEDLIKERDHYWAEANKHIGIDDASDAFNQGKANGLHIAAEKVDALLK